VLDRHRRDLGDYDAPERVGHRAREARDLKLDLVPLVARDVDAQACLKGGKVEGARLARGRVLAGGDRAAGLQRRRAAGGERRRVRVPRLAP
jgi:hypothetical protein